MTTQTPWLYGLAVVVVLDIVAWLLSSNAVRMVRVPVRLAAYVILIVLSLKLGVWPALALWWGFGYLTGLLEWMTGRLWWSDDRNVQPSKDWVMVVYGFIAWPISAPFFFVLDLLDFVYSLYEKLLPNRVPHYKEIERCRKAAISGDARAQFTLGRGHQYGQYGLPQDDAEAVNWFRKAAEQNHGAAQLNLGVCLADGTGVEKNVVEGLMWIILSKFAPPSKAWQGGWLFRDSADQQSKRIRAEMTEQQIADACAMVDSSPLFKEVKDRLSRLDDNVDCSGPQPAPEKAPPT